MLRLAFDFIITWRETRTRPNAYMERNHDWPLISSKKTNPSHMLWFPSYLRGIPYRYGYIR